MTISLRSAKPGDGDVLYQFICELARYEREPDAVCVTPSVLDEQLAETPSPFECLIAERDGDPVGFALYFQNYSTWRGRVGIHLEDLFVLEDARGLGIGRLLLRELARIAVARQCPRLEWAVLDWNRPAIDFYERLGAEALTEWTTFRLSDEALARLAAS